MNFSPFGNPFSASISGIHQFAAGAQVSKINALGYMNLKPNLNTNNKIVAEQTMWCLNYALFCLRRIRRIVITTIALQQMPQIWIIAIKSMFRYCRNFAVTTIWAQWRRNIMAMETAIQIWATILIKGMCPHIHHRPIYIRTTMINNDWPTRISRRIQRIRKCINRSQKSRKTFAMRFWINKPMPRGVYLRVSLKKKKTNKYWFCFVVSFFIHLIWCFSFTKCEFGLAIVDTEFSSCWLFIAFAG